MKKKVVGLIICLVVFLVVGYFVINQEDNTILKNAKMVTKKNNNMISMMLETSSGSGEYEKSTESTWPSSGYTFNADLSKCENGSGISWENNKVLVKSSKSDKCYVYFDKMAPAKYWNDNFSSTTYTHPKTPSTASYNSLAELQGGYANFASKPYYIKTTATEHQTCLYYNNKEFCLSFDYWVYDDTDGSLTTAKLNADMEAALGVLTSSCISGPSDAICNVSSFSCHAYSNGIVRCDGNGGGCNVFDGGDAGCY